MSNHVLYKSLALGYKHLVVSYSFFFFYEDIKKLGGDMLCMKQEWSYLRGGLTTLDRDYGWINNIHHDIGTHVIHHLFPQIPHYHLVEAVSMTYILSCFQ